MAIQEAKFLRPFPVDRNRPTMNADEIFTRAKGSIAVAALIPGHYDFTPDELKSVFTYSVLVTPSGIGLASMSAVDPECSVTDLPLAQLPPTIQIIKHLDENSKPFMVAGPYSKSPTGFALYELIWFINNADSEAASYYK